MRSDYLVVFYLFIFLFLNNGDVSLGGLKGEFCLNIEIRQDLDLVVFDHLLCFMAIVFLFDFKFLLPTLGTSVDGRPFYHGGTCNISV